MGLGIWHGIVPDMTRYTIREFSGGERAWIVFDEEAGQPHTSDRYDRQTAEKVVAHLNEREALKP